MSDEMHCSVGLDFPTNKDSNMYSVVSMGVQRFVILEVAFLWTLLVK